MIIRNFAWFHQNAFYHRCLVDIIKSFFSVSINCNKKRVNPIC